MTDVRRARGETAILWFVALGGMSAFALHLIVGFYLVPFSCFLGTRAPLYAVTVLFAGIALAATVLGWRRRTPDEAAVGAGWPPGRGARVHRIRFMVYAGIVLNVLGLGIILYAGAATLFFDPCVNWRV